MSLNSVAISGNVTRDAEVRTSRSGVAIMNFDVAVNERRKDANGEWTDYANFIPCVFFGTRAEKLAQYITKGTKVSVSGKLHWSSWEKDGQKRSKIEVFADEIEFMSRNQQPAPAYRPAPQQYQPRQAAPAPAPVQNMVNQAVQQAAQAGAVNQQPEIYDGEIPWE